MYKCMMCSRTDSFHKPHINQEYNLSRMCIKCQDKSNASHYCFDCKIVSKWSDQNYSISEQKRNPICKQCRGRIHENQKVVKCEACKDLYVWNINLNKWVSINGGLDKCLKTKKGDHILYL